MSKKFLKGGMFSNFNICFRSVTNREELVRWWRLAKLVFPTKRDHLPNSVEKTPETLGFDGRFINHET